MIDRTDFYHKNILRIDCIVGGKILYVLIILIVFSLVEEKDNIIVIKNMVRQRTEIWR